MDQATELTLKGRAKALAALANKRRKEMKQRWPLVDFDAPVWKIRSLHQSAMMDVAFGPSMAAFASADPSYILALRCLVSFAALEGNKKLSDALIYGWRLLASKVAAQVPLAALRHHHLVDLESELVKATTEKSALKAASKLASLSKGLGDLARQNVVDSNQWSASAATRHTLRALHHQQRKAFKVSKASSLDQKIEAFSEVTAAMLRGDSRLSAHDRSAIAFTNILMCAPSRINEPLTLMVEDRYTIEDYSRRDESSVQDELHRVHQLLLMKGSKGADWAPKPILNFMIKLVDACWGVLLKHSERSRTLLSWYEKRPNELYLPAELEHLRGHPMSVASIWQVANLSIDKPNSSRIYTVYYTIWSALVEPTGDVVPTEILKIDNPQPHKVDGRKSEPISALPWADVERYMLSQVRKRMERIRKVSPINFYEGKLSEMLVLIDSDISPYLPQAWTDNSIRLRLKSRASRRKKGSDLTVFEKLNLRMTEDRKEVYCYLEPHDTRRWLTTKALEAKERLSDVLINKWANRLNIGSLAAYDLRDPVQKANQAAMPELNELADVSKGLQELEDLESQYGLYTEVLVAHGEGISMTSMEAICEATGNRPVARTGNQIIIIYPNSFGACTHQHHTMPCRSYRCGSGCNDQLTVKGHIPTNERWRKEAELTNRSIVNQLQNLITAHNRGIADDPQSLGDHVLALIEEGLDPQAMTTDLVERFHEIKDHIRDPNFKRSLEDAFVAKGMVSRLDDPNVTSGALIKYHNPARHAAPGHERAIEAHFGSREEMTRQSEIFYQHNPEFAPSAMGLRDETHLLAGDDESGERDEEAA